MATRVKPPAGFPAFIVQLRQDRGWKQHDVFVQVREHFGWGESSLSLYGDVERGKKLLSAQDQAVILGLYGKSVDDIPAPDIATTTDTSQAALIAALQSQAQAINALADQVRALVEAQETPTERAHAVGEAVGLAVREALRAAGLVAEPR